MAVYVDSLNLHYCALRGTTFGWLDPARLSRHYLRPSDDIVLIRYFTSLVTARHDDPGRQLRQQTCLRALRTIPDLSVHFGHHSTHAVRMPLAQPTAAQQFATVLRTTEKGSDVNLATHLMNDAHMGVFDLALMITNDSDLAEPARLSRGVLGLGAGLLCPASRPSEVLRQACSFCKVIRRGPLAASQLPDVIEDNQGVIHRPASW